MACSKCGRTTKSTNKTSSRINQRSKVTVPKPKKYTKPCEERTVRKNEITANRRTTERKVRRGI
tara:strand:+ start:424 stop:615 length:192 start_codon:yes stop_codon:yes gene_type:complete